MSRLHLVFFALLLPLQFAWSAASAYCQHEATGPQSQHFGHHFHTHAGEPANAGDSKLMADADCAACHAGGVAGIPMQFNGQDFAVASPVSHTVVSRPFTSALARAPDRPQWLRLV